ncbi:unnamed protein product [Tilletia controversa]|nr:unnamed protein product [Tilletia controversa]
MQTTAPATDGNRNAPQSSQQGIPILNHAPQDLPDLETETSPKVTGATQTSIKIPTRAPSAVPDAQSTSTVAASSSKRMLIPGRASLSTNNTSAAPVQKGLADMRAKDMTTRWASYANSLRMGLSSTYSGLEEWESVFAAIDVLETTQSCDYGANGEEDAGFVVWLEGLERLKEEDNTDEDELAEGFGHKAVGSWKYDEALKDINTWGTTTRPSLRFCDSGQWAVNNFESRTT